MITNITTRCHDEIAFELIMVEDLLKNIFQFSHSENILNNYSLVNHRWQKNCELFLKEKHEKKYGKKDLFISESLFGSYRARYFLHKTLKSSGLENWKKFNPNKMMVQFTQLTAMLPLPNGNILAKDRWGITEHRFQPTLAKIEGIASFNFSLPLTMTPLANLPQNTILLTSNAKCGFALARGAEYDAVTCFNLLGQAEIKKFDLQQRASTMASSNNWIAIGTESGQICLGKLETLGFSDLLTIDLDTSKEVVEAISMDEGVDLNLLIKTQSRSFLVTCCLNTLSPKLREIKNDKPLKILQNGHLIGLQDGHLKKLRAADIHQLADVLHDAQETEILFLQKLGSKKIITQNKRSEIKIWDRNISAICSFTSESKEGITTATYRAKMLAIAYKSNTVAIYDIGNKKGQIICEFNYTHKGDIVDMQFTATLALTIRTKSGNFLYYSPF